MSYSIQYAARTDRGLVRSGNEDAYTVHAGLGLVLVADGMGGYNAGEVASRMAVDTIGRQFEAAAGNVYSIDGSLALAGRAVAAANLAIAEATAGTPGLAGMGTTVVIGQFLPTDLVFAWVGDSRLYRFRGGSLERLTSDHTLVQELVDQGMFGSVEEAMAAGIGDNVLTRALGTAEPVAVADGCTDLAGGDLLLFCTDGLNHMVGDDAIGRVLSVAETGLDGKAQRLVELACEAGGMDNVTVVLAQVDEDGGPVLEDTESRAGFG